MNLRSFSLIREFSYPFTLSNVDLNSWERFPISEREMKFCPCLFMVSMKREIRNFYDSVVQKQLRNVQKSVMHVQSCCFVLNLFIIIIILIIIIIIIIDDLDAIESLDPKVFNIPSKIRGRNVI